MKSSRLFKTVSFAWKMANERRSSHHPSLLFLVVGITLSGFNIFYFYNLHIFTNHGHNSQLEAVADVVDVVDVAAAVVLDATNLSSTPASDIVHRTFNNTFLHLNCPKEKPFKVCLHSMYEKIQSKKPRKHDGDGDDGDDDYDDYDNEEWSSSSSRVQHWWFQSMIRDAGNIAGEPSFVFGPWHVGQATDPNVSMCMIEKIGIKHWTKLFTSLNNSTYYSRKVRSDESQTIQLPASGQGYPSFVVLRDPLDRFLSAYLDKCVDPYHRKREEHCEPNEIYRDHEQNDMKANRLTAGYSFGGDDDKVKDSDMKGHRKTLFSMYVDTMPLKWNLHFFPQSLYCDGLYRFIDDYDFVGHMGSSFYNDLEKLGSRYGGRFETKLKEIFDYSSKLDRVEEEVSNVNVGIETKASEKVMQYYTPRSLRKVLEYVSIDYALLDLRIPEWAEEMLREDENGS